MLLTFLLVFSLSSSQGLLFKKFLPSPYEIAYFGKESLGKDQEKLINFFLQKETSFSPNLINEVISKNSSYKEIFEDFKKNTSEVRNKQRNKNKSRSSRSSFKKFYQSFDQWKDSLDFNKPYSIYYYAKNYLAKPYVGKTFEGLVDKWLDSEISKFYPKFRLVKAIAGEIYYYEDKLQKNLQDNFKILKDILRYRNLSYKAFENDDEKLEEEWDKSIEKNFDLIYKTHYFQSFAKKIIENKSSFLYFINEIIAKHELLINKQIKDLEKKIDLHNGKDDFKILHQISNLKTKQRNLNKFRESKQDEKILNYLGIKSFKINSFSWEEQVINSKINIEYKPESKFASLGDIEKQFDIVEIIDLIKSIDDWEIQFDIIEGKFTLTNRYKKDNKIELLINPLLEKKIDYYLADQNKYEKLGITSLKRFLDFRDNVIKQYDGLNLNSILYEARKNILSQIKINSLEAWKILKNWYVENKLDLLQVNYQEYKQKS